MCPSEVKMSYYHDANDSFLLLQQSTVESILIVSIC